MRGHSARGSMNRMLTDFTRRRIVFGATSFLGTGALTKAFAYPAVSRGDLARWRSVPGLEGLEKAFEYLASAPLAEKPEGRTDIDGDRIYVTISQNAPLSPTAGLFEAHRNYADIHVLIAGKEMIGSAPAATLKPAGPYKVDAQNFYLPAHYEHIILSPGQFAVFRPGQGHLPGRSVNGSQEPIRKAVVKFKI